MTQIYKDKSRPILERVEDLLSRMTLHQKIRQLSCIMATDQMSDEEFADGIGQIYYYARDLEPEQVAVATMRINTMVKRQNPFGIPPIIHNEALSGLIDKGHALFPTSIGLGATFMPELVEEMGGHIRRDMLNVGIRQALSPVLDLARDFRWGRTGEDYSSDPTLVAEMACAYIRGLQGDKPEEGIIATAKHFLGYSVPENGLNCSRTQTDKQDIMENFAKPFEAAIRKAGLRSIMNSYAEFEGEPVCSSESILTDLLRDELGFDGIVVSDYTSVEKLHGTFKTAETPKDAGIQALIAGMDCELPSAFGYGTELEEAVKNGELDVKYVDRAVRRVLKQKFELGLFDTEQKPYEKIDLSESDRLSGKIAQSVITLVKNNGILPLKKDKHIAIIGPTANTIRALNGGYTWPSSHASMLMIMNYEAGNMNGVNAIYDIYAGSSQNALSKEEIEAEVDRVIKCDHPGAASILEELQKRYERVTYAPGCGFIGDDRSGLSAAYEAARDADVVVLAVGGKIGWDNDCTCGEGMDNVDIGLPGIQEELLHTVIKANKNVVVVHTDVKPLVSPYAYENAAAVLEAWMPGPFGGAAVAKAIAGELTPGGRLPVDVPRHTGQTPIYYYQHHQCRGNLELEKELNQQYRTVPTSPQLPFGFGLSYTEFAYTDTSFSVDETEGIPTITICITVKNTGMYDGDDVIQLYGVDRCASIVRPHKILLGFRRVTLKSGEGTRIVFKFRLDQLAFPDKKGRWLLEKGDFDFLLAENAESTIETFAYHLTDTRVIDRRKRGFWAETQVQEA